MKVSMPADATILQLATKALEQPGVTVGKENAASLAAAIEARPKDFSFQRSADSISIETSPEVLLRVIGDVGSSHERAMHSMAAPSVSVAASKQRTSGEMPDLGDFSEMAAAVSLLDTGSVGASKVEESSFDSGLNPATYRALFTALANSELSSRCVQLGKGMNKRAYILDPKKAENAELLKMGAGDWVILSSREGFEGMNWRAQHAEVGQLIELRNAGVLVPEIGFPAGDSGGVSNVVDDYLGEATEKGEPCRFFLEQCIHGIETDKKNFRGFSGTVCDEIEGRSLPRTERPSRKEQNALKDIAGRDIARIVSHLEKKEIPDFQAIYEPTSGHVYVIDPGDPELSNVREQHLNIAKAWQKHLPPPRDRR